VSIFYDFFQFEICKGPGSSSTQAALYGVIVTAAILFTLILVLITIGICFFLMRKNSRFLNQKTQNKHSLFRNSSNRRRHTTLFGFSSSLNRHSKRADDYKHQSKLLLTNNQADKYSTFNSSYGELTFENPLSAPRTNGSKISVLMSFSPYAEKKVAFKYESALVERDP
jgi:hypothetical protein